MRLVSQAMTRQMIEQEGKLLVTKQVISENCSMQQLPSEWLVNKQQSTQELRVEGEGTRRLEDKKDDPYMKAWLAWVERERKEKEELAYRLGKQEALTRKWDLLRKCNEVIKESYSGWEERKIDEEEKRKLLDL